MPHGRSQWAWTTRVGLSKASRMDMPPPLNGVPGRTYHRGPLRLGRAMAGAAEGVAFAYSFLRWKPFKVQVRGPSIAPTVVPGEWAMAGDHPDLSIDSRHFGAVTSDRIRAKVRLIYWPPSRRRFLYAVAAI